MARLRTGIQLTDLQPGLQVQHKVTEASYQLLGSETKPTHCVGYYQAWQLRSLEGLEPRLLSADSLRKLYRLVVPVPVRTLETT